MKIYCLPFALDFIITAGIAIVLLEKPTQPCHLVQPSYTSSSSIYDVPHWPKTRSVNKECISNPKAGPTGQPHFIFIFISTIKMEKSEFDSVND